MEEENSETPARFSERRRLTLTDSTVNTIINKTMDIAIQEALENEKLGIKSAPTPRSKTQRPRNNFEVSVPILSEKCTIPYKIIQYDHSYGFDCKHNHNLCLIEANVLVFASGNLIHFFDISTKEVTTRRTWGGGGIGCITKNPNPQYNYLTVAENGKNPPIYLYEYPKMNVINILKNGTTKEFSKVDYSVDGELLCSQGEDPDFTITIWDWKKGEVILRSKSFINDVLNVVFSPSVPGQLTSSGLGHIKFWKMSETFTGLKLQGELGRFGKTEICDIIGIYPMPDEKVLSGSDWGNILVWEDGLIKVEVCRKGRKPCHAGLITQIFMKESEGEVMTIGLDGYARIWFWETVELADPPDTDRFVEIDPMYEYAIGTQTQITQLISIVKKTPADTDYDWYAQDGNGGIWLCEISPETGRIPKPSKCLLRSHSGEIVAIVTSPTSNHFATLGRDGRFIMYDYEIKKQIFFHQFIANGSDCIWFPVTIDPTGVVLALSFSDGVIRIVKVDLSGSPDATLQYIQVLKPHAAGINKISINEKETVFVSGGDDNIIFVHSISKEVPHVVLRPIGLVNVASPPTAFCWKPNFFSTLLAGCRLGDVYEIDLPERERSYTDISFNLYHIEVIEMKFKSTKSQILRDNYLKQVAERKEKKRLKKMESLEHFRKENPGVPVNEEQFLADSEDEEELEPLYFPKIPNPILWLQYTPNETVWISMGGYDAGYVYEYQFGRQEPVSCTEIPDAADTEIHCFLYLDNYLIFGMGDGVIRVNKVNNSDFRNLSDYWLYNMHDNRRGVITAVALSFDSRYLFSGGRDGNVFSYNWGATSEPIRALLRTPAEAGKRVMDIEDPNVLSLEQQKRKDDYDRRMKIANDRKDRVLSIIAEHQVQFHILMERNLALLESQRIPINEFLFDSRINDDLNGQLEDQMKLLKRQRAYDFEKVKLGVSKLNDFFIDPLSELPFEVHGILNKTKVKTFTIGRLTADFFSYKADLRERIVRSQTRKRVIDEMDEGKDFTEDDTDLSRLESFLSGLTASTVQFRLECKMRRLLTKYRARKAKELQKKIEWERVRDEKPDPNANHPDDEKALAEAEKSIGENKLKTDPAYNPPENTKDTTFKKYTELLNIREKIFEARNDFNRKVQILRSQKELLQEYVAEKERELQEVHLEIPIKLRRYSEVDVLFDVDKEYPMRAFDTETIEKAPNVKIIKIEKSMEPDPKMMLLIDAIGLKEEVRKKSVDPSYVDTTVYTEWEEEMRDRRRTHKLFEQDSILKKIRTTIENFDKKVSKLFEESITVDVNVKFLETYILAVNQELWILKDYEKLEDKAFDKIDRLTSQKNEVRSERHQIMNQLNTYHRNIDKIKDESKSVVNQFMTNCMNTNFTDFLKKIFKKKYKPPKLRSGTDSESSSSSEDATSSSDEGPEMDDYDLGDIGNLYLDENVCPPGLDPNIYDLTIALRNRRYQNEKNVIENTANIEKANTLLADINKKLNVVDSELKGEKDRLTELCRIKQNLLNNVETLVVLKMNQLQYFRNPEEFADIENTLLFNNESVTKLYARVGQLAQETMEVERRHKINVMHLARMKTDIKFMDQNIIELKEEIHNTMLKKFGREVDLDELEETVLRRFAYEMRANIDEIKKSYMIRTGELKKECSEKKQIYARVIQQGSERIQIQNVLEEQNNYLTRLLLHQEELMQNQMRESTSYRDDLLKLREISKNQQFEIAAIEKEIKYLGCKHKPSGDQNSVSAEIRYNEDMKSIGASKGQGLYEENLYKAVMGSICDSPASTSSQEERNVCTDMEKCVDDFLVKAFGSKGTKISEDQFKKLSHFMSRYFASILPCFTLENYREFIPHIRDNLESFLPPNTTKKMTSELIGKLLESILFMFKPELKVNIRNVIKEIVSGSVEAQSPETKLQPIITELFKEMMRTFSKEEISNNENIRYIGRCLKKQNINWDTISDVVPEDVVQDIQNSNEESGNENFSDADVKNILDSVINELTI